MRGFRARLDVFKRNTAEMHTPERLSLDLSAIPENGRPVIEGSLEELGITMYSGALCDSVCNVAGALIMQKESEGVPTEHFQRIIESSMRDLGFHRGAIEECDGDPDKAAALNLARISRVVQVAYGEIADEIKEIPQNPAGALVPATEKTIAA